MGQRWLLALVPSLIPRCAETQQNTCLSESLSYLKSSGGCGLYSGFDPVVDRRLPAADLRCHSWPSKCRLPWLYRPLPKITRTHTLDTRLLPPLTVFMQYLPHT
ncbi:hypothetical protein F4777DRAFT_173861 [Nemania sp. FL0916]|nr:hypothetical protein F4777DRAFT_173861 [Nemania sp. FL0916]